VVRENLVLTDSIGFLTSRNPCFRNENADLGGYRTISQSGGFRVVPSGGRTANHRAPSATRYLYAHGKETDPRKQRSTVLAVTVKGLERLGIRVDLRESGDRDSMEDAEVSRVLAEEVAEQARQTCNFS
jgi:hypothetical protein